MPKPIVLRPLTDKERKTLEKIAKSQTAPARQVERAKTVLQAYSGMRPVDIAKKLDRSHTAIYRRLKLFNEIGLESLDDRPRAGRPATYNEAERGQMIQTARTHPHELGRAYNHWTLDRLVEYINQELQIGISRAQLGKVLAAEGLRWYQEATYFTERPDPQFVEKRGL